MYLTWDVCSLLNVCIYHSHLSTIVWRKINKYENDNENFPQYYEFCERKHFLAGRVNVDSDAESVCIAWMWSCVRVANKRNNSNTNSASNWGGLVVLFGELRKNWNSRRASEQTFCFEVFMKYVMLRDQWSISANGIVALSRSFQ